MAKKYEKETQFMTRWYHRQPGFWFQKDRPRPEGHREAPEVFRLDVEPGVTPSPKPPVRIFLGTEPLQARAERVFLWSVKQHRDPARVYEVYLMKDLKGFDRSGWKTGFTNYRYAIPALAGNHGRAIYNDVDQIYLADPAEMFDLDMKGAGILCITERDNSVTLIDCDVMAARWTIEDARKGLRHKHFRDAAYDNGLWGRLPGEWNARDQEFVAGRSKCFHFTTLQSQPWRPFPDQLRYQEHPQGEVWFALERAADAARFNGFTRESPGAHFRDYLARSANGAPANAGGEKKTDGDVARLVAMSGAKTLLDYSAPRPGGGERAWPGTTVTSRDGAAPFAAPVTGRFDGVVAIDSLSAMPEEDVPWALDELFAAAERFVYAAVAVDPALMVAGAAPLPPSWWRLQFELASNRNPGLRWVLLTVDRSETGEGAQLHEGSAVAAKAA
ncbi:hypothetical protein [Hansschlegelia sp. KR7-227]|uniref:hypothetical protein n=1 Tax=Hansschlegelia sp. KR7-227 TaxID=3400914 RepID=UPI003C022923